MNDDTNTKGKTMYQIKFTSGYEIQVIGKGDNGLCRVVNEHGVVAKTGTYAECEAWLNARAVKSLSVAK
jgi:hypothetical protein